jgi:membrane protein required for colicin V production
VVFLAGFTEMGRAVWWQESLLVAPFERTAVWGRQFLPENIAKYHQYGEYGE